MLVVAAAIASTGASTAAAPTPAVRLVYAIPKDRAFNAAYSVAVQRAFVRLQAWYGRHVGLTFHLHAAKPLICRLPQRSAHYAVNTWGKVERALQPCAGVASGSRTVVWVVYADVPHACKAPGALGGAELSLAMLDRHDLDGLVGRRVLLECGDEERFPPDRYVGGAGHELGHAFGLPHPPGCEEEQPTCDTEALMWLGYVRWPRTYLRTEEKVLLRTSPFFVRRP